MSKQQRLIKETFPDVQHAAKKIEVSERDLQKEFSVTNCWRCGGLIEYEKNDIRPFVYHLCNDGMQAATRNPNMKKQHKVFGAKKTLWQGFD